MIGADMSRRISRRSALTMTAAGVATVAAARFRFAKDQGRSLHWGVIGAGAWATAVHIPALKRTPESRVVALCDTSERRLASAAASVGDQVETCSDYRKLLANPEIDAVLIATPTALHREMVLASIAAGKHVLCETPAGVNLADATAIEQAAGSAKTKVIFCIEDPSSIRMKIVELVTSGAIGQPRHIAFSRSGLPQGLAEPESDWRRSVAGTGGMLNEFACQDFDLIHRLAGTLPERICANGGNSFYSDGRDTWDWSMATLNYPNEVTAVHSICLCGPAREELKVIGTKGAVIDSGDKVQIVRLAGAGPRVQEIACDDGHTSQLAALEMYREFSACVMQAKQPRGNVQRAVTASRTCCLAELSCGSKSEMNWEDLV
jgi:predicted dehydrogenase